MTAPLLMLAPSTRDLEWPARALCTRIDPDLFYTETEDSEARAKRTCKACPVTEECLEYALSSGEPFGVWGGLSESERKALISGGSKRCTGCKKPKGLSEFHKDSRSSDGRRSQCKDCSRISNAGRQGRQIDAKRERRRAARERGEVAA